MIAKPRHLAADYAEQFGDRSVVAAYSTRPPHAPELFAWLARLMPTRSSRAVLELGAGSGDVTLGLAPLVAAIDAVEPSRAMLAAAQERAGGANVRWIAESAEVFRPDRSYALAVAAESLHWMDWEIVLPKLAEALETGAFLAIVTERALLDLPWAAALRETVPKFSTNHDYRSYDVVEELTRRRLFEEVGRNSFIMHDFSQTLDDYVESFHSRNGFSRERMSPRAAADFDYAVRDLVRSHCADGHVHGRVRTTLVWGAPLRTSVLDNRQRSR